MSAFPISNLIIRYAAAFTRPIRSRPPTARSLGGVVAAIETSCQRWLIAYSIAILRVSLGTVFFVFGALKFFPGVSPAQDLVERTTDILMFGLIPGPDALVLVATLECVIGLCLISGRAMRGAIYLLAVQLVGILSPLVLFPGRLFAGPHGAPTLEGQYVLKDVILVGAALVLAATLGNGRLTSKPHHNHARQEHPTAGSPKPHDIQPHAAPQACTHHNRSSVQATISEERHMIPTRDNQRLRPPGQHATRRQVR